MVAMNKWLLVLLSVALLTTPAVPASAAVKAGQKCTATQAYKVVKVKTTTLQCLKSGSKYVWTKVTKPKVKPTTTKSTAITLSDYSKNGCSGSAPAGWSLIVGSQSASADLWSPDKSMVASWGLILVPAVRGGFGSLPPYNDPNVYSSDPAVSLLAHLRYYESTSTNPRGDLAYTADPAENFGNYTARTMRSSKNTMLVLYTTIPGDGLAVRYIIIARIASTPTSLWASQGANLAHYALSIKCTTAMASEPSTPKPTSSKKPKTEEGDEVGYNPWLGKETVHDPVTGTNVLVSPSEWQNDTKYGAGYYNKDGDRLYEPGRAPGS